MIVKAGALLSRNLSPGGRCKDFWFGLQCCEKRCFAKFSLSKMTENKRAVVGDFVHFLPTKFLDKYI